MGKGGIPDRWLPYKPMGSVITGTRFIACKVPLKEVLMRNLKEEERFGPVHLLDAYPQLGLLIDLTNTTRYYHKQEISKHNVQYEKLQCPGHIVPADSIVKRFFAIVEFFEKANANSGRLIAVHCTHGVNRTGYFICRYMIERLNIPPKDALERFRVGRGHAIERMNYVNDLMNRCKEELETSLQYTPEHQTAKRGNGNMRNECNYKEVKYSNWRRECRYQLPYGTRNDRRNIHKPRKYDSSLCQTPEATYDEPPCQFQGLSAGPSQFQWTPDNDKVSMNPPVQNKRNKKIFIPNRTRHYSDNSQLPHYGVSSHISYGRIRDDDQWAGGILVFNNGNVLNHQRSSRYGHGSNRSTTNRNS